MKFDPMRSDKAKEVQCIQYSTTVSRLLWFDRLTPSLARSNRDVALYDGVSQWQEKEID